MAIPNPSALVKRSIKVLVLGLLFVSIPLVAHTAETPTPSARIKLPTQKTEKEEQKKEDSKKNKDDEKGEDSKEKPSDSPESAQLRPGGVSELLWAREENPLTKETGLKKPFNPRPKPFLRIMCWNLQWFPALRKPNKPQNHHWHVAAVANLITRLDPDLAFVQEVKDLDSLETLHRNMGSFGFTHLAATQFGLLNKEKPKEQKRVRFQNGLLSKVKFTESWEVDFESMTSKEKPPRGWLAVKVQHRGLDFIAYNLHLPSSRSSKDEATKLLRRNQRTIAIELLGKDLRRKRLDPIRDKIIIIGDFGIDFHDKAAASEEQIWDKLNWLGFDHRFQLPGTDSPITRPVTETQAAEGKKGTAESYIWFSSAWGARPPKVKILREGVSKDRKRFGGDKPGVASDHYPIFVDIPFVE